MTWKKCWDRSRVEQVQGPGTLWRIQIWKWQSYRLGSICWLFKVRLYSKCLNIWRNSNKYNFRTPEEAHIYCWYVVLEIWEQICVSWSAYCSWNHSRSLMIDFRTFWKKINIKLKTSEPLLNHNIQS